MLGQFIAEYSSDPPASSTAGTRFLTSDHLASTRLLVNATSGQVKARYDYLPFGESLPSSVRSAIPGYSPSSGDIRQKFTGYERDTETGLDFARTRYYNSVHGRFTSPDEFWKDSTVGDPQSWNKYAYGRNNPLRYVDPTGEKATVTVKINEANKLGTIQVVASMTIWSKDSKISAKELNAAAEKIKSAIEKGWNGQFTKDGITYTVATKIDIQVATSEENAQNSGTQNVIELVDGEADLGVADSFVRPNSLFGGPDSGVWNINTMSEGAGHEFAHLLGVGDRQKGAVLSNTNLLKNPFSTREATTSDFWWAFGPSIRANRLPRVTFGLNSDVMVGPAPTVYTWTYEIRAPKALWWN